MRWSSFGGALLLSVFLLPAGVPAAEVAPPVETVTLRLVGDPDWPAFLMLTPQAWDGRLGSPARCTDGLPTWAMLLSADAWPLEASGNYADAHPHVLPLDVMVQSPVVHWAVRADSALMQVRLAARLESVAEDGTPVLIAEGLGAPFDARAEGQQAVELVPVGPALAGHMLRLTVQLVDAAGPRPGCLGAPVATAVSTPERPSGVTFTMAPAARVDLEPRLKDGLLGGVDAHVLTAMGARQADEDGALRIFVDGGPWEGRWVTPTAHHHEMHPRHAPLRTFEADRPIPADAAIEVRFRTWGGSTAVATLDIEPSLATAQAAPAPAAGVAAATLAAVALALRRR